MPQDFDGPVLAMYDFRSKQEYIYRTNRIREITGGSLLIAGMYGAFLDQEESGIVIYDDWRDKKPRTLIGNRGDIQDSAFGAGEDGVVVYEGGGNLCVLFRDYETYARANRSFSYLVLRKAHSLSMVSACVGWERMRDAKKSFVHNLTRLYRELDRNKRIGGKGGFCNVLPYTMVDRATFQPIVTKRYDGVSDELSQESLCKRNTFKTEADVAQGKYIDDIGTEKGEDSLIAVIYFDGNSIGEALKSQCTSIEGMRRFSKDVHEHLVERTEAAMREAIESVEDERQRSYRIIIDHGDEITLICNAHVAPLAIDAYFGALDKYHACAGMAICHAHDPFSEVYKIAEQLCESGKARNRRMMKDAMQEELAKGTGKRAQDRAKQAAQNADRNYIDFHFCRSGITGTLEQIRSVQESGLTCRPYEIKDGYATFLQTGCLLARKRSGDADAGSKVKRTDLKELNRAILRGDSWYALEYERIKAKDPHTMMEVERVARAGEDTGMPEDARAQLKNLLFDVTSFYDVYDLRFAMGCQ